MRRTSRRIPLVGAAAAAAALLWTAAPLPADALCSLRSVRTASDPVEPLVAVLALGAQALVLWLALVVLTSLAAELPGPAGRVGAAVARCCAPAVVRRGIGLALGISVSIGAASAPALASPVAAVTAVAASAAAGGSPQLPPHVPDLDWPALRASPPAAVPDAVPPLAGPAGATALPGPAGAVASPSPAAPARRPAAVRPPAPVPSPSVDPSDVVRPARRPPAADLRGQAGAPPGSTRATRTLSPSPAPAVVVRPGDTLWALAESALTRPGQRPPTDAAVARAWPRWWAANREVIGDDPDLILPGTTLQPPPPHPSSRP